MIPFNDLSCFSLSSSSWSCFGENSICTVTVATAQYQEEPHPPSVDYL